MPVTSCIVRLSELEWCVVYALVRLGEGTDLSTGLRMYVLSNAAADAGEFTARVVRCYCSPVMSITTKSFVDHMLEMSWFRL